MDDQGTDPNLRLARLRRVDAEHGYWQEKIAKTMRHKGKAAGGLTVAGLVAVWSLFGTDIKVYAEDQVRKTAQQEARAAVAPVEARLEKHIESETELHKETTAQQQEIRDNLFLLMGRLGVQPRPKSK